jgi:hypothetical protein
MSATGSTHREIMNANYLREILKKGPRELSGHTSEDNTVTCISDYRRGFGLANRFIDHLQVVADFHTINHSTLSFHSSLVVSQ